MQTNAMIPMNDLARGITRDRDLLLDATRAVLDSGWVVMGPQHETFQSALAEYWDVKSVSGVASGTDALELAIKVSMPTDRSTVLTAANAGGYTSTASRRVGFRVRYADVDPTTLCLTDATVEQALIDDVGVVVVTHLYGNVTDIRALVALCHDRGIRVVEDWAQSMGATQPDDSRGIVGDLATTSFYPTKNLGAIGDGGAVATNNESFADRIRQLRQYGWESKYRVAIPGGTNSRLDELQAAFLLTRLPQLNGFNERRRSIVALYIDAAHGGPLTVLPARGNHHVAHLAVGLAANRDDVRAQFAASGVATDIHFPVPDHLQPGFESEPISLPVTEKAADEVLSLPCFPELTDDEITAVCHAIEALQ